MAILPPNDYIPKIWENKWFNDNTIGGYSKGDIVWKWALTEQQFLDNYGPLVKKYADANERTKFYLPASWSSASDKAKYVNVISGYAENIGTKQVYKPRQYLPMLFDYCFDYGHGKYDPSINRIEIYISLVDDNKSMLSDTTAWKNVAIRTNVEQRQYLSSEMSALFDQHVKNYHLDGAKTQEEFDTLLLAANLSNFSIDDAYSALRVRDHTQYINQQGIDYVTRFGKTISTTHVVPLSTASGIQLQTTKLYKWYRLWSSGYLEHGGTVELPTKSVSATNQLSDYEFQVDLNWEISSDLSAPAYDYPISAFQYYGSTFDLQYFAKKGEQTIQSIVSAGRNLDYAHRYSVSLTPVSMVSDDIVLSAQKFKAFNYISSIAYPQLANDDKNHTYVNFEVHDQQNSCFKITRSCTRDLRDVTTARYVQYYTSGYLSRPNRDYSMLACSISNLMEYYIYDGHPLTLPDIEVWTNDGDVLTRGIDYVVYFDDALDSIDSIGQHTLYAKGNNPYRGTLTAQFWVSREFSDRTISVHGLDSRYRYGG